MKIVTNRKWKSNKTAFTLVELIVTIIILAILWTIAFISLIWYSKNSRDSVRVSDLSRMKTSLEIFNVDAWKFPEPSGFTSITYSGAVLWKQWIFWESVVANLNKLDKIPSDPLTNSIYSYSVTSSKNEYQLWWIFESDELLSLNSDNQIYAWTSLAKALVVWNYNWKVIKALNWTTCNILSVPSILVNDTSTSSDLQAIIDGKNLVYEWYNNLPNSFSSSKFKFDWWFDFTPNNLVLYTDTWSCSALSSDVNLRVSLYNQMINSYSWTTIGELVSNLWTSDIAKVNDSKSLVEEPLWIKVDEYSNNLVYLTLTWSNVIDNIIDNNDTNTWSTSTGSTSTWTTDITAPLILSFWPSWTITSSWVTLNATTDENSTCKYALSDLAYWSMTNTFSTTWLLSHSWSYTPSEWVNNIYVKCSDSSANVSTGSTISFTYNPNVPVDIYISPVNGWSFVCEMCD